METERRNLTQPPEWWAAFEAEAARQGKNLSEWVGQAAKAKLPKEERSKLTDRRKQGRPKKVRDDE